MANVQIAVIDPAEAVVNVAVPGIQGPVGTTGSVTIAQAGTAAVPGIRFESDTNTGIYSPGADQLALSTAGNGRLFIDGTGFVGIGTVPSGGYGLDVRGHTRILSVGGSSGLEIGTGTATNQFASLDLVGDATYTDYGLRLLRGNSGTNAPSYLSHKGTGALSLITEEAAPIVLVTSNTERLRITSTGALNFVGAGTAGVTQAVSFNGSAPVNSMVLDSSGRVGIGASSPATSLDVQLPAASATLGNIRVSPTGTGQARYHLYNGGEVAEWLFGQKTNTDHSFKVSRSVAGSEADYVAIGTSGIINIAIPPTYADNAAATSGGLVAGDIYRKSDGTLMIRY